MDNVLKKFFAFNTDHSKPQRSQEIRSKQEFLTKTPSQVKLLHDPSNAIHVEKMKSMDKMKNLEEKLLHIENKHSQEKNELFQLIKSGLIANKNNTPPLRNYNEAPNYNHLPNINEYQSTRRRFNKSHDFSASTNLYAQI
jgi:hypothetical protein